MRNYDFLREYNGVNRDVPFYVTLDASVSPVSVEELRDHLYLFDDDSYDAELDFHLLAAQRYVDDYLGEFVSSTGIQVTLSDLRDVTILPHYNIEQIDSVQYYNDMNNLVTIPASNYFLDREGKERSLVFTGDKSMFVPNFNTDRANPLVINYTAGFGGNVPQTIFHAIKLYAADLFNHRANDTEVTVNRVSLTAERLLSAYRRF